MLAVLDDATALKTLEAQFVQSQKMQSMGQLAGGIAHDFNNLLTAISGHCDLLLLQHGVDEPDYADLVQIRQNANRAASLVGQLLAYSRKQTLRPERIDLADALSELTHLMNRLMGEKVRLSFRHGNGLGPIRADKRQLEQVLINLVVNARDAMAEGGTIRISTEAVTLLAELRRDRAVVPPGDYALLKVADTGHGIPPDRIEKIFEPFYTTKRPGEGTGLGLSTAYGIVKQSGGFIFVDSDRRARARPSSSTSRSIPTTARTAPSQACRCHSSAVRWRARAKASCCWSRTRRRSAPLPRGRCGCAATPCSRPRMPRRRCALLEDPTVDVDIFVTDVVMPGMDGPSWVRKALEQRPNVKVVFVSGYAEDSFADTQLRIAEFGLPAQALLAERPDLDRAGPASALTAIGQPSDRRVRRNGLGRVVSREQTADRGAQKAGGSASVAGPANRTASRNARESGASAPGEPRPCLPSQSDPTLRTESSRVSGLRGCKAVERDSACCIGQPRPSLLLAIAIPASQPARRSRISARFRGLARSPSRERAQGTGDSAQRRRFRAGGGAGSSAPPAIRGRSARPVFGVASPIGR